MAPKISVIIPAYNTGRYIASTIRSVLDQSLADFELIVVNDGSTDDTEAVVLGFDDPRLKLISKQNAGVSVARNTGLAACTAPLVVFLDGDDLLNPSALATMTEIMEHAPQHVACFGQHEKIADDGSAMPDNAASRVLARDTDTLGQLVQGNFIVNGGTLCIRTGAARSCGGFDPALRLGEDWEFWCRLALLGDFKPVANFTSMKYRQRISGANVRLTGSGVRPNFEAVDAIFANPDITSRLPQDKVALFRHQARKMVFWTAARNKLMAKDWPSFIQYAAVGLVRYPPSLSQLGKIKRFVASLISIMRTGAGVRSST